MIEAKSCRLKISITNEFKSQSDRLWNQLISYDCCILEEYLSAGTLICDLANIANLPIVQGMPGILSAEIIDKPKPEKIDRFQDAPTVARVTAKPKSSRG